MIVRRALILIFASTLAIATQSAPSLHSDPPKGWREVRDKHGCAFSVPADWGRLPSGTVPMLGTPNREIYIALTILPRNGPVSDIKQRFSKTHETVVEESPSKIWTSKPRNLNTALAYVVRQDLPKSNSICSLLIDIERPLNLPAYRDIAQQIAKSVHED